jgi:glycosyltransferase involved in cell wall biosynthesis
MQLKYADRIIAVSEIIKHDWGNDERIEVIYDPITITEKLAPYKFEQSAGGVFKFLYLANYIKGKGQEDALSAIKYLKEELGCSDFTVNFYGGTMNLEKNETYKQSLRDFVTAHKLADFVTLHEAVSDVEAVMKKYQGALHFSHSESFGMVCFEALYYGLPVISSDCGGPAEMIEDGISGILLPVSDYKSFAAAMKRWIINPEDAERIGKNAATFIQRKFLDNPNTLTNMFTELYESKGRKN